MQVIVKHADKVLFALQLDGGGLMINPEDGEMTDEVISALVAALRVLRKHESNIIKLARQV